jgi:hypothetical protein
MQPTPPAIEAEADAADVEAEGGMVVVWQDGSGG